MTNVWAKTGIIALWLTTMGWLVGTKVVPPLMLGEPPNYQRVSAARRDTPPIVWAIAINGKAVGHAVSWAESAPGGLNIFHSRVQMRDLKLDTLTPSWTRPLLRWIEESNRRLNLVAEGLLVIDALGQVSRFSSDVGVDEIRRLVRIEGIVNGKRLDVHVRSGEFRYDSEYFLPTNTLMGDAFSPEAVLPGLRVGQTWRVPSYNPLRQHAPLELLRAEVIGREWLTWSNDRQECLVLVYRSDRGYGSDEAHPRAKMWVRRDGAVLKQESQILDTTLVFERLNPADGERYLQRFAPDILSLSNRALP